MILTRKKDFYENHRLNSLDFEKKISNHKKKNDKSKHVAKIWNDLKICLFSYLVYNQIWLNFFYWWLSINGYITNQWNKKKNTTYTFHLHKKL
jgi:hypothetical protein